MKKIILSIFLICGFQVKVQAFPEVLDKAIYYSFDVPIHLDKEIGNKCYGIEDDDESKMLITNCGGYLNVIFGTLTLGLMKSSSDIRDIYTQAAEIYLTQKNPKCKIIEVNDLGGRIFELTYNCK